MVSPKRFGYIPYSERYTVMLNSPLIMHMLSLMLVYFGEIILQSCQKEYYTLFNI